MIFLKTEDEIDLMRAANQLVAKTLTEVGKIVTPGVTTRQLDKVAEEFIRDHGGIPTFLGFPNPSGEPFPASICTSVNGQVVHGIPSDEPLKDGDIVSVDCGALLDGFNGDSCYTFRVGEVSEETNRLLKVTKEALYLGIEAARVGRRIGDIGYAVQQHVESNGYGVVREFVGHGIGRDILRIGDGIDKAVVVDIEIGKSDRRCLCGERSLFLGGDGDGKMIKNGLCIAIEPMIVSGSPQIWMLPDKWTIVTRDGGMAAHYEHTIAVHQGKTEILSSFEEIEKIENQY